MAFKDYWKGAGIAALVFVSSASFAHAHAASAPDTPPTPVVVQSMMDELYPKTEEASFRSREEKQRIATPLDSMIDDGLYIQLVGQMHDCGAPALFHCILALTEAPEQREMVVRYAMHYFDKLGLSGSSFGNSALPEDALILTNVDHWINWSQCFQPDHYPDNAISCELAYHPFPQPGPGVRALYETRDGRVASITFYVQRPQTMKAIVAERDKLANRQ